MGLKLSVRTAVLGSSVVFAALLWVITIDPPLVAFSLAVAVAIAWCLWLEKHPDEP